MPVVGLIGGSSESCRLLPWHHLAIRARRGSNSPILINSIIHMVVQVVMANSWINHQLLAGRIDAARARRDFGLLAEYPSHRL
jgi:hypothetical protein